MLNYYPPNQGEYILEKLSGRRWCAIPPHMIHANMCVVVIVPASRHLQLLADTSDRPDYPGSPAERPSYPTRPYPVLSQPGYVPHNQPWAAMTPQKFIHRVGNTAEKGLKYMPSFKYELNGVKIVLRMGKMVGDTFVILEGSAGLTGEVLVKPREALNPMTLSGSNIRHFQMDSIEASQDLIRSLKIGKFNTEENPFLTLSSSLPESDALVMTSTSISLKNEGNTIAIEASCLPPDSPCEIKGYLGLTMEVKMGYQFSGKASSYPLPPTSQKIMDISKKMVTEIASELDFFRHSLIIELPLPGQGMENPNNINNTGVAPLLNDFGASLLVVP